MVDLNRVLREVKRAEERSERAIRSAEKEAEEGIKKTEREREAMLRKTEKAAISDGERMIGGVEKEIEAEKRKANVQIDKDVKNLRKTFEDRKGRGVKAIMKVISE